MRLLKKMGLGAAAAIASMLGPIGGHRADPPPLPSRSTSVPASKGKRNQSQKVRANRRKAQKEARRKRAN